MSDGFVKHIAYTGPSMSPTFRPGDMLVVVANGGRTVRAGDVVVFRSPENTRITVHRVFSVDAGGIKTRGDNNRTTDRWILSPDDIVGRVVYAYRGCIRKRIFRGSAGQLIAALVSIIHVIDDAVSELLRPAYNRLVQTSLFKCWIFPKIRIRILSIKRPAGQELYLMMGRYLIGRYRTDTGKWQIRRPYRLFLDETCLPKNPSELYKSASTNACIII